jgi:DNA-binding beta-propeller fold protein YncE
MNQRAWWAWGLVLFGLASIGGALLTRSAPTAVAAERAPLPARLLPGLRADGFVQLPNQWSLRPAGRHYEVGDLPVQIAPHPGGQYLAVLHAGFGDHEVMIVALEKARPRIVSRTIIPQTFIGCAWTPDGRQLFAAGGETGMIHAFDFARGVLSNARTISVDPARKLVIGGLGMDPQGRTVFAACTWGDAIVRIPVDNPDNRELIPLTGLIAPASGPAGQPPSPPDGRKAPNAPAPVEPVVRKPELFPYTCLVEPTGQRVFVSLWARAAIAVLAADTGKLLATWPTESHPTEMTISPDGKTLFVACANSTKVSLIDLPTGTALQTVVSALYPLAPNGNTPNSLCLSPDGSLLFVANADANNVAVFNVTNPRAVKPLGFIPVGWYPTSVRCDGSKLYVTNGKGVISRANRNGPNPNQFGEIANIEYIGRLYKGALSVIDVPTPAQLAKFTETAYQCSPLRPDATTNSADVSADNPIPRRVGEKSPIKYVIYVIKENRTYDQVFGDLPQGNGDPSLCLFPQAITPNHHKLASEYVLFDNFYVEGEVSADGHEWSMAAYATDFVEKTWPLSYRGSPQALIGYTSEGNYAAAAQPAGGYLWDRAKAAGVSYRSYGEFVENGKRPTDPGKATVPALEGHIDPLFRSYDLDYPDVQRAERFLSELRRFEKEGGMPQLSIVRLPNDHTAGTRVGKPTPTAMVAENDLALGLLVEGVSKSKFWSETAIFVIEDDAQNGPDHVDAHRVVALCVSPYTKRGHVDSTMYSTSSMLRTMELILGLQPMSQFDAAARPLYHAFQPKPDVRPYAHVVPQTDLKAKNEPTAWGAQRSAELDLSKEDAADDIVFNEIIWRSVRGPHSKMPAPVRAAFVIPTK